jgi:hypothetical protein
VPKIGHANLFLLARLSLHQIAGMIKSQAARDGKQSGYVVGSLLIFDRDIISGSGLKASFRPIQSLRP